MRGWAAPRNRKRRLSRLIPATRTPRLTRLRLQIVRALRNGPQTTRQLLPVCFPRLTKFKPSHYHSVRRAAQTICVRARSRPLLWNLRPGYRELTLLGLRKRLHSKK